MGAPAARSLGFGVHLAAVLGTAPDDAEAIKRDEGRKARYREYRAFAAGEQWQGRPAPGRTRQTFNYARALLRKTASYLFPAAPTFAVPMADPLQPGGGAERAQETEQLLAGVLAELDAGELDFGLAVEAMVAGDAAVKVTWDGVRRLPRLVAVDCAQLDARWAADDPTRALWVRQTYTLPGDAAGVLVGVDGLDPGRWYPVQEEWTERDWLVAVGTTGGEETRRRPNPFGWLPYVILANDREPTDFWGRSDLDDLLDVCRALNHRLSVLTDLLDLSGYPIAVLENVEGSDGVRVGPGAKWEMPEGSKAYLLDLLEGGGVRLHLDYVEQIRTTLHDLAETPRTAFGDSGRDLSGAALEVEVQPLVQKVRRKRRQWDGFYRQRNARVLDLMERFGGFGGLVQGRRRTAAVWPPVLPSDDQTASGIQTALVAAGIKSRQGAMQALGEEDPAGEFARILAEAEALAGIAPEDEDDDDGGDDDAEGAGAGGAAGDPGAAAEGDDEAGGD